MSSIMRFNGIITLVISFSLMVISTSCKNLQEIESGDTVQVNDAQLIETIPDKPEWIIPDRPEQFLRPLTWNLQHQKIWVRFDFSSESVIGRTELLLTSNSSFNNELILDAKNMNILELMNLSTNETLEYFSSEKEIKINLPMNYTQNDTLIIAIEYIAHPNNRGLYFVNPDGSQDGVPTQIWTLGQPEDNSYWLPTVDHPAVRATQETWISVPDKYTSISNGILLTSNTLPGDSLRTDYWLMDKPHAPYLFALAVGEYVFVEELHQNVLLRYYAEPQFRQYISYFYANTADMIDYFTKMLRIEYPWYVYAQVPVRSFIAQGMENTTATFLYDRVQATKRQSLDIEHQDLIAHEVIHQWFGNLVTCKDWANLPLNEGFASYFEILYRQHRNGSISADWKTLNDRNAYFRESQIFRRPIIWNRYNEPEDLYDRHTYEKAGQVLRMLHHKVGDDHWWGALHSYLSDHAFSSVDWTDLSESFERESGEVLYPFFEQWFTSVGHPELSIVYKITDDEVSVSIKQTQDLERQPVFNLDIDIYITSSINNEQFIYTVNFSSADTTYSFDYPSHEISDIVVDPGRVILAEFSESLSVSELISRLAHPSLLLRYEALVELNKLLYEHTYLIDIIIDAFLNEPSEHLRYEILKVIEPFADENWNELIHSINEQNEPYFRIRIKSADISARINGIQDNLYLKELLADKSYFVEKHIINLIESTNE